MHTILLQASPQPAGGGLMGTMIMFGLVFAIMYFLMIRPQQKKQKEMQELLSNLKVHDTVITTGGIVGKIISFKAEKDLVVLRIDETTNTKIDVQRQAIVGLFGSENKEANQG
jgi:preprotein translocase subunit YajC